jgi:hypothetical protein
VDFNEPLTLLQRMTENMEYSELLDQAATVSDPRLQLCNVAAFAVSGWCNTVQRTGKPFNPLLGETFECDRQEDLGWRSIAEQVSRYHCQQVSRLTTFRSAIIPPCRHCTWREEAGSWTKS